MRIGLPRALLYYEFGPLWETFFRVLGAETIVSPPTTRAILEVGIQSTVDEACLPVKVALGHLAWLRGRCDAIFIPRVVSWQKQAYTCPKLMGLPDMARAGLSDLPPLLAPTVNVKRRPRAVHEAAREAALPLTRDPRRVAAALRDAMAAQARAYAEQAAGRLPGEPDPGGDQADADVVLAVLGHPYTIYDRALSLDLIRRLRGMRVRVVTAEMLPRALAETTWEGDAKPLYWTFGRRAVGGALRFVSAASSECAPDAPGMAAARRGGIDGIIHLVTFGCGPDSLTGELLARRVRQGHGTPLLVLTVDEHTGEAGLVTRLEAFLDLIRWRRAR